MDEFQQRLREKGIKHTRNMHFGSDIIGWSKEDDDDVRKILKMHFKVDLNALRNEAGR